MATKNETHMLSGLRHCCCEHGHQKNDYDRSPKAVPLELGHVRNVLGAILLLFHQRIRKCIAFLRTFSSKTSGEDCRKISMLRSPTLFRPSYQEQWTPAAKVVTTTTLLLLLWRTPCLAFKYESSHPWELMSPQTLCASGVPSGRADDVLGPCPQTVEEMGTYDAIVMDEHGYVDVIISGVRITYNNAYNKRSNYGRMLLDEDSEGVEKKNDNKDPIAQEEKVEEKDNEGEQLIESAPSSESKKDATAVDKISDSVASSHSSAFGEKNIEKEKNSSEKSIIKAQNDSSLSRLS